MRIAHGLAQPLCPPLDVDVLLCVKHPGVHDVRVRFADVPARDTSANARMHGLQGPTTFRHSARRPASEEMHPQARKHSLEHGNGLIRNGYTSAYIRVCTSTRMHAYARVCTRMDAYGLVCDVAIYVLWRCAFWERVRVSAKPMCDYAYMYPYA